MNSTLVTLLDLPFIDLYPSIQLPLIIDWNLLDTFRLLSYIYCYLWYSSSLLLVTYDRLTYILVLLGITIVFIYIISYLLYTLTLVTSMYRLIIYLLLPLLVTIPGT